MRYGYLLRRSARNPIRPPTLDRHGEICTLPALAVYVDSLNRFRERLSFIHGGRYLAFSLSDECRLINGVWLPRLSLVSIATSRQTCQSLCAQSLWKRGRNEGFSGNPRRGLVTELAKRVFTWRRERFCKAHWKNVERRVWKYNNSLCDFINRLLDILIRYHFFRKFDVFNKKKLESM